MTDAGRSRLLGQHCAGEGQSRLLWAGWRLKWRRGLWPPVGERTLDWLRGVIDLPPLMMVETLLWTSSSSSATRPAMAPSQQGSQLAGASSSTTSYRAVP